MSDVRDAMGEEAIIVATREERDGRVTVTAAIDEIAERALAEAGKSYDDWLYDDDDDEISIMEEITDVMLRHAVPEEILEQITSYANILGMDDAYQALTVTLDELFTFEPLPAKPTNRALMMVGAPGSGKTLAVAKMGRARRDEWYEDGCHHNRYHACRRRGTTSSLYQTFGN